MVEIALRSLLDNAWKFTRETEAPRIEVGEGSTGGERAFFVRDSGIGFDIANMNQVFAPLERLHGVEQYEGTGLGLPMAKRIVERHGGRIWAAATLGKGATFYFTLAPGAAAPNGA
jgi:light-regulated signal transduction histidine kinase (bacteriophytochrome)